jgi:hypothetical protein
MLAAENALKNLPLFYAPKEAWLYEKTRGEAVVCNLCAHRWFIPSGRSGVCKVRENRAGTLYTWVYDRVISLNIRPHRKKTSLSFSARHALLFRRHCGL